MNVPPSIPEPSAILPPPKLLAESGWSSASRTGLGLHGWRQCAAGPVGGAGSDDPADAVLRRDAERLSAIRGERSDEAAAYFARNAARWDEIRSLYVAEETVEAAIVAAAGGETVGRLVDLGAGTGRMLTLLGPRAKSCLGLDLSQQMLNIARSRAGEAGLSVELRHGDIFATRLPAAAPTSSPSTGAALPVPTGRRRGRGCAAGGAGGGC